MINPTDIVAEGRKLQETAKNMEPLSFANFESWLLRNAGSLLTTIKDLQNKLTAAGSKILLLKNEKKYLIDKANKLIIENQILRNELYTKDCGAQKCEARQYSDQMVCMACSISWDINDKYPPKCKR